MKRQILNLLLVPGVAKALSSLTSTHATIFMLHRFSVPDLGVQGHDCSALRRNLAHLRREGYNLLCVEDLIQRLVNGAPLNRAIAFTIDDGYIEQAQIAAPIFADFDCPVSCFVATGFLDRKLWFWWDRLMYIFEETKRRQLTARIGTQEFQYQWDSETTRRKAWWNLNLHCQDASEENRLACVRDLSEEAEVELPLTAPARFAPMTWDMARRLQSRGVSFGPHTVTHPVLGTTSATEAEWEITESWQRLNSEIPHALPVFCYPNGRACDIGDREISCVQRLGLRAGLMAQPGELNPAEFRQSAIAPFRVPRFAYSDDLSQVLQSVSGLENLKARVRSAGGNRAHFTRKAVAST